MTLCPYMVGTIRVLFTVIPSGMVSDLVSSQVGLVAGRDYPGCYIYPYPIGAVSDLVSSQVV